MRRILLAAVMFGAASGAQAADLSDLPILRGAFTDGLTTAQVNWQGFYVGGQGGYGTSDMNFTGSTRSIAAQPAGRHCDREPDGRFRPGRCWARSRSTVNGYGGFAGYNCAVGRRRRRRRGQLPAWQVRRHRRPAAMARFFSLPIGFYRQRDRIKARRRWRFRTWQRCALRAGYAWGCFLPYAFGGVALGQADIIRTATHLRTQVNPNAPPASNVPFDSARPMPCTAT